MDLGQFTWTNLIATMALLLTGSSMLIGVWWHLELRIRAVQTEAERKLNEIDRDAAAKRSAIQRELTDFKIHVVEKYASWDTVEKTTKRLEDRIELMASDVNKMPDFVVERIMKFVDLKRL